MSALKEAWKPLPDSDWNRDAAKHLAARLGFSINPAIVNRIQSLGPAGTLKKYFSSIRLQPVPDKLSGMETTMLSMQNKMKEASPEEKRKLRQSMQKQNRQSYQDYAVDWYQFAREPRNSAQEKLVLFFQDVWVVAVQGTRSTSALFDYQNLIRRHLGKSYPEMCKQLAVSAAMVRYLNLNQNRKESPNENFARELFELFCLGEGNYSEDDIKQAARATTGYIVNQLDEVRFIKKRHDAGRKTIFAQTDNFDLNGLIDLVFQQPASARFLPKEMARFYLTQDGLTDEEIQPLADIWRDSGYSIPKLLVTFFTSRKFYDSAYRGNMIKSPVQFYLGMLQDLDLDVFPSPRRCVNQLRTMGQQFFNPPNVRGWVGGRHWINSATLTARRGLVQSLMYPVQKQKLNADEERALEASQQRGKTAFSLSDAQINSIASMDSSQLAKSLASRFYINPDPAPLEAVLKKLNATHNGRQLGVACAVAALTSPAYHLC